MPSQWYLMDQRFGRQEPTSRRIPLECSHLCHDNCHIKQHLWNWRHVFCTTFRNFNGNFSSSHVGHALRCIPWSSHSSSKPWSQLTLFHLLHRHHPGNMDRQFDNWSKSLFDDVNKFRILKRDITEIKPSLSVNFLDMALYIENGKFVSRTFQKKINLHLYIPPSSEHPASCI